MSTQYYHAIVDAAVKHDSRGCRSGRGLCLVLKPRLTAVMLPCGTGAYDSRTDSGRLGSCSAGVSPDDIQHGAKLAALDSWQQQCDFRASDYW